MNIYLSQNLYTNKVIANNRPVQNIGVSSNYPNDIFVKNSDNTSNNISFKKRIYNLVNLNDESTKEKSGYRAILANGMNKVMETNIHSQNLKNIMSPYEFKKLLPELSAENFNLNKQNIDKGIYCADLDYQSNFSEGKENVFDILDKVNTYADKYYKKTGKDFIFALTDRDSIEGLQHIVKVFSENQDKYKHIKLLPGIKLSFEHKAPNSLTEFENSEMLIYGINPYSQNLINFVDSTIHKRKEKTIEFISQVQRLYPDFSFKVIEFAEQNNLKFVKDYTIANLYWRAREYVETKGSTAIKGNSMVPKEITQQANEILENLSKIYIGSGKKHSAKGSQIITDSKVNKEIKRIFKHFGTHYGKRTNEPISKFENTYKGMIDCLSKEEHKPVLAIASPLYFSHYFKVQDKETLNNNIAQLINNLKDNSNDMLIGFESISPYYLEDLDKMPDDSEKNKFKKSIKEFNDSIREKTNLFEVGGSMYNYDGGIY